MQTQLGAESNEKSIFRFLFFLSSRKFIENWGDLSTKITNDGTNNADNNDREVY